MLADSERDSLELARLRALFSEARPTILLLRPDTEIVALNKLARALCRRDFEAPMERGDRLIEHMGDEERRIVMGHFRRALLGETIRVEEHVGFFGSTERRWYEMTFQPLRNESDEIDAVAIHVLCATNKRRAQAALRESEDALHRFCIAGEFVLGTDEDGVIGHAGEAAKDLLDLDPGSLVGRSLPSLCHPHDRALVQNLLDAEATAGEPLELELRLRAGDASFTRLRGVGIRFVEPGHAHAVLVRLGAAL